MDINLYSYVGKEVYATLQNGEVLHGTVQLKFPSETGIDTWGCHFWIGGFSYTIHGLYWQDGRHSPKNIVAIGTEPPVKPNTSTEEFAKLIKALEEFKVAQEELATLLKDCLSEVSNEMETKLPENFSRPYTMSFLKNPNIGDLIGAFHWGGTPQGNDYWQDIAYDPSKLTDKDRIQLQEWVIASLCSELTNQTSP